MTVACCHSDREAVFASTRNLFVTLTRKDSSVAKSSFRMTAAFCHSDREVFYFDEDSFLFQHETFMLSISKDSFETITKQKQESRHDINFKSLSIRLISLASVTIFCLLRLTKNYPNETHFKFCPTPTDF